MKFTKTTIKHGVYSIVHEDPLNWVVYKAETRPHKKTGIEREVMDRLAYTPSLVAALRIVVIDMADSAGAKTIQAYIDELNAAVDRLELRGGAT
jgi:hypothetical protein